MKLSLLFQAMVKIAGQLKLCNLGWETDLGEEKLWIQNPYQPVGRAG